MNTRTQIADRAATDRTVNSRSNPGRTRTAPAGIFALGFAAALMAASPTALADPAEPVPPPPVVEEQLEQEALVAGPVDGVPDPAAQPGAEQEALAAAPADGTPHPAGEEGVEQEILVSAPEDGLPHLHSPENLPPGTSADPVGKEQGRNMTYLRELWHAVKTQDVTMADAIFLFTQRPLNPDAKPPNGLSAHPQPQLSSPESAALPPSPESHNAPESPIAPESPVAVAEPAAEVAPPAPVLELPETPAP